MTDNQLLTTEQVADELNCSPRMVRLLCQSGELSHHRVGRVYRISRRHLDDYLSRTEREIEQPAVARLVGLRRRVRRGATQEAS